MLKVVVSVREELLRQLKMRIDELSAATKMQGLVGGEAPCAICQEVEAPCAQEDELSSV